MPGNISHRGHKITCSLFCGAKCKICLLITKSETGCSLVRVFCCLLNTENLEWIIMHQKHNFDRWKAIKNAFQTDPLMPEWRIWEFLDVVKDKSMGRDYSDVQAELFAINYFF